MQNSMPKTETIPQGIILQTRDYFMEKIEASIKASFVEVPERGRDSYIHDELCRYGKIAKGECDSHYWFRQRATFYMTGENVSFL